MPTVTVNGSVQVIEVDVDQYTVQVGTGPVQVLTVGTQGPPGPPGPASPGTTYVYNQGSPATTWTITHNLGQYPSVTVVDSGGTTVGGSVNYLNSNTLEVTFTVAFGGKAYLN